MIDMKKMPRLGFGLMRLPQKDGKIDHEQVCKMVDAYLALGGTVIDTCYTYLDGCSEEAVRRFAFNVVAPQYEQIYRDLLSKSCNPSPAQKRA